MIYLTWGIGFNGIYLSQVVGACEYMSELDGKSIKLISFVPYTHYKQNRLKIKENYSNSIVLPMIPSRNHWWPLFSIVLLPFNIFFRSKKIMTRGVIANQMGLLLRRFSVVKKVIYDGRGAEKAEWIEYDLGQNETIIKKLEDWERNSVLKSDFRLAVSKKLADYWIREYSYKGKEGLDHVIIPCTINVKKNKQSNEQIKKNRNDLNFSQEDIVLVYSGSVEGWQSFQLLDVYLDAVMKNNSNVKILFLAQIDLNELTAFSNYKTRFTKMWVSPSEVPDILNMCDYGLLIREDSVTNQVASPTKFAEYLNAGLKIIISENVGDFSSLVVKHNLGFVIKKSSITYSLNKNDPPNRAELKKFGLSHFEKDVFRKEYGLINSV